MLHEKISVPLRSQTDRTVRYAGIVNLGATGYMDAILQQFFMAPSFRNLILSLSFPSEGGGETVSAIKVKSDMVRIKASLRLAKELQIMFQRLDTARNTPICEKAEKSSELAIRVGLHLIRSYLDRFDPTRFVTACEGCLRLHNEIRKPNDAFRFAVALLEEMAFVLKNVKLQSDSNLKLEQVTGVTLVTETTCRVCHVVSSVRRQHVWSPALKIRGYKSVGHSLADMAKEELHEARRYCASCLKCTDQVSQTKLADLPSILSFRLQRFEKGCKLPSRFELPKRINVARFSHTKDERKVGRSTCYELAGAVVHKGNYDGGRYYSYIRERDQASENSRWLRFWSESVHYVAYSDFEEECFGGPSCISTVDGKAISTCATMVFYERISDYITSAGRNTGILRRIKWD